jgi:HK97 family phage major capsid protein
MSEKIEVTESGKTPEEIRANFLEGVRSAVREEVAQNRMSVDDAVSEANKRAAELEERLAEIEKRSRVGFVPGTGDYSDEKRGGFNLGRVCQSVLAKQSGDHNWRSYAELEWEMSDAAAEELRAQGTTPDTSGGFIVPGQVMADQFIEALRPQVVALDLGATEMTATTTPIEIPKEATPLATAASVAENAAAAETSVSFGQMRLEPHTCASFIKASRRLLDMGSNADGILRQIMTREIALEWNRWVLKGTGTGNEPVGIYNQPGIASVDFSGLTASTDYATYELLLEMEDNVADANALQGRLGWAMSNKCYRALRTLKSEPTATSAEWGGMTNKVISEGGPGAVLGYPFRRTTQLAGGSDAEMIFGDWSQVVIPRWGNLVIEASNVANDALQRRQTHIVAYVDIDVGIRQPGAFAVSSGWDLSSL